MMKKIVSTKILPSLLSLSFMLFALASCDKNDDPSPLPEPDDTEEPSEPSGPSDDIHDYMDLSADGMANCYIVMQPGFYRFKADNRFNLGEGLPVPPEIDPSGAKLVWQTSPSTVKSVEFVEEDGIPYIEFEVSKTGANALIACTDNKGNVQWSWHIWMPLEEITSVSTDTGYEVMNMNLGALNNKPGNASSYGFLYQWGRKDPFPASATLVGDTSTVGATLYDIDGNVVTISNSSWTSVSVNNLAFAIANPTVCLSNFAQYSSSRDWLAASESDDTLWGAVKTCYDPSPAGWRVADPDVFRNLTATGGYVWNIADFNVTDANGDGVINLDDYNFGWYFNVSTDTPLYFPAAARYDGSYAMLMGSVSGLWGNYWSNAPYPSIPGGALCCLAFQIKDQNGNDMVTVSPAAGASRADAFSIRCIRE